jgi:hypothetical protein
MPKQILYLDQNFISEMAKAEDRKDSQRQDYQKLLSIIRTKVNQNRLVCPASQFHREESAQDERIKRIVWPLVEEFSRALEFHKSTQILDNQVALAGLAYYGKEPPHVPGWAVAFNKDPLEPVQHLAHLESPGGLIDNNRDVVALITGVYGEFKTARHGESITLTQHVDFYKKQLVVEAYFVSPEDLLRHFPEQLNNPSGRIGSTVVKQRQQSIFKLLSLCSDSVGIWPFNDFWNSKELLACPFLTVRASLMAVDISSYPEKHLTTSLNNDFEMVASVLPYVDMLATENYMAEIIRQAKLSQRFKARVFSRRQVPDLLETLEKL